MYSAGQNAWWIESMLKKQWQREWTWELGLATKKQSQTKSRRLSFMAQNVKNLPTMGETQV